MKKIVVLAAAIAVCFGTAFAEKYVSANDLDVKKLTSNLTTEDGFVIHSTADKQVEITAHDSKKSPSTVGNETFTKRIKIGGAGNLTGRSISIKAKAGETLKVYAKSTTEDERVVNILDQEGNVVGSGPAGSYSKAIPEVKFKIPADGEYFVTSKSSGIYIFEIILE